MRIITFSCKAGWNIRSQIFFMICFHAPKLFISWTKPPADWIDKNFFLLKVTMKEKLYLQHINALIPESYGFIFHHALMPTIQRPLTVLLPSSTHHASSSHTSPIPAWFDSFFHREVLNISMYLMGPFGSPGKLIYLVSG